MPADFSPERRATALSVIRGSGVATALDLSYDARVLYAVGTLICSDCGHMKEEDLQTAMKDPSIIQAARTLLREARG